MKYYCLCIGALLLNFIGLSIDLKSQITTKPSLKIEDITNWPYITEPIVTADGKYAAYSIIDEKCRSKVLNVNRLGGKWTTAIEGVTDFAFGPDDGKIYFIDGQGMLKSMMLGHGRFEQICTAKSFTIFKNEGILFIQTGNQEYLLLDRFRKIKKKIEGVIQIAYCKGQGMLFLVTGDESGEAVLNINLRSMEVRQILKQPKIEQLVISKSGKQMAFFNSHDTGQRIFYFRIGRDSVPRVVLENRNSSALEFLKIISIDRIADDGKYLIAKFSKALMTMKKTDSSSVAKIWSFADRKLVSQLLKERSISDDYFASVDLASGNINRLQFENEIITFSDFNDQWATIRRQNGSYSERRWNLDGKLKNYVVNCASSKREEVNFNPYSISTDGKYMIGSGFSNIDLVLYDLYTKKSIDVTSSLLDSQKATEYYLDERRKFGFVCWIIDEPGAFIFRDDYDLWKLSSKNTKLPICITNGFGRKNQIIFSLAEQSKRGHDCFHSSQLKILTAFNNRNKQNGYYRIASTNVDPILVYMGDYLFHGGDNVDSHGVKPIKADSTDIWIVTRQNVNSAPNLFFTKDFRHFSKISNFYPETRFNWLTSELVNYNTQSGSQVQGILYKPENFNASKKYPVIIHYYDQKSSLLNAYLSPGLISDEINIPYFVSNGYLLFVTDISYETGHPAESACRTAIGAANKLLGLAFVDSTRIGLQGHSFGGYQTNSIITRTGRFAAAMSSSGFCDLVSAVGSVTLRGGTNFFYDWATKGQGRIGADLWDNQNLFVENSPIFGADKVSTPLLMMNNELDGIVNVSQGLEFFIALRRFGKKVWMLQYPGEGHSLTSAPSQLDYTNKMKEFFDHYLKGSFLPNWMKTHN